MQTPLRQGVRVCFFGWFACSIRATVHLFWGNKELNNHLVLSVSGFSSNFEAAWR